MKLEQYKGYSRKDIRDILAPSDPYTKGAGTWGMLGIVNIKGSKDYAFIVNDEKRSGYGDELYTDGNLLWYSQNRMDLKNKDVINLINHDHNKNNIYFFWKPKRGKAFYYLGLLEYVSHDVATQNPVRFYWHIIDFDDQKALKDVPGLQLINRKTKNVINASNAVKNNALNGKLTLTQAPPKQTTAGAVNGTPRTGVTAAAFQGGNVDFEGEAKKNSKVGNAGEDMVVKYEKDRLNAAGCPNLANQVVATRKTIGNAAKYDVESYETNGAIRYIEVKTTTGSIKNRFFISEREVAFSESVPNQYYLYRVYDFDKETGDGKLYIEKGKIDRKNLKATNYVSL